MQTLEYRDQQMDFTPEIEQLQDEGAPVQGVKISVGGDPEKLIVILGVDRMQIYLTIGGARELALALRKEAGQLEKIGFEHDLIKGKQKPNRAGKGKRK